jgi:hypothetical protein
MENAREYTKPEVVLTGQAETLVLGGPGGTGEGDPNPRACSVFEFED